MVFNQKNLNQDLDFDSSIYAYENIPMNPTSNTVFPKEQVSFSSVKQIPLNFNISNSNPQVIINEISSSNPLVQNIYKDISMLASYEESVNFEESSSVNSQIPCRHGEKIKKRKRSTTNSGSKWHWNEEEDRLLIQLVEKHGNKMWNFIAKKMPLGGEGKPLEGKQLRDRYNNHLKPGLKKEAWREEEDLKLIEAHGNLGNKWVEIAKMLPGRSECDVKNRWNATKRRCLTAIKQRNIPKSNSLFENYVNSILSEKDPNGPISVESNAVVGPESNSKNNEHANGPSTCFGPNELPCENIGQALVSGSNGLPSSDPNNLPNDDDYNILLDLDYLMDMVNGESSINVESDIIVGPEGNGDNKEQALVDGSNGLSTCFNQNNLLGENNEEALAKGSNDLSISSDQNEFPNDDKDSDWGIIEKLIYASDDNDNDDDDSDNENDDGSGSDESAE